ncbi:MAG: hypothetical protein ACRDM1_06240, partial [Gaiellaceae bacterium]
MRSSTALLLAAASACLAGCGATRHAVTATVPAARAPADGLRVLVVGPLHLQVAGARIEYGTLAAVAGHALVVVSAQSPAAASIGVAAAAHPETHFALAGASARKLHLPNLAGLVIDAGQAAR